MNIAVMGYGTVGSGVVEVFFQNRALVEKRAGTALDIKYILDLRKFPGDPYESRMVQDFDVILSDDSVGIVVEVMGGVEPAFTFTKKCLERGKSVVSSNKELVAKHGAALLEIARASDCNYFFEASVGGGIPVLRPLQLCLAANQIEEIAGIFNGTTNFILTKMIEEQKSFDEALALAQKNGFAERDPSADVQGHDACRKIAIMADMAFHCHFDPDSIPVEGITNITMEDVAYAADWGGVVKLIGRACRGQDQGEAMIQVSPALLSKDSQIGACKGVYNAIMVRGDAVGDVVFYGQGAGKQATSSAILSDIMDCALLGHNDPATGWEKTPGKLISPQGEQVEMYYRLQNSSEQQVRDLFGQVRFLSRPGQGDEVAFVTEKCEQSAYAQLESTLEGGGAAILGKIRVLHLS